MKVIPWRRVKSWQCLGCGDCCRYTVQLSVKDWVNLTRTYGFGIAIQSIGGFYLRKTVDDVCPFLIKAQRRCFCSIQQMKPIACELWPFKILVEPKYGHPNEAHFQYRNRDLKSKNLYKSRIMEKYKDFYIYVNPSCHGIIWGKPTDHFVNRVLREFVNIRMGLQKRQYYTTSK